MNDLGQDLHAWVEAHRARPFAWAVHDCATFALGWAGRRTGKDFLAGCSYDGPLSAQRMIRGRGGWVAALAAAGFRKVEPPFAGRGDVGLIDGREGETLVLVLGRLVAAPGPRGLVTVPRSTLVHAFRCPS